MTFEQWMRVTLDRVETALEHYLPTTDLAPARLHEAMRYAVLGGGKRVRPGKPQAHHHNAHDNTGPSRQQARSPCSMLPLHGYRLPAMSIVGDEYERIGCVLEGEYRVSGVRIAGFHQDDC